MYLTIGAMIQKDIKGTYSLLDQSIVYEDFNNDGFVTTNKSGYSSEKDINQSNPQFSTQLSLGISYPLYKKLYLYGAVGGIYYFDASNKYRTIYSDKQTQFNMNAGLKWKF